LPNKNVIQTRGLSKSFGEVQALSGLDLTVPEHSITGFLGPNGAGKTTTIRLLLGLNRPSVGGGTIFGRDIVDHSVEIRKRVGYLAQQPRFYEDMTAREILRFAAHFFYSGPSKAIEERVGEMLELVDLQSKADRKVKGFSGGERQRLGIAQAQINDPELLILDEPAASLDPMGRLAVLRIMERLRDRATIFYSTHILDDVQRVSDRVAILNHGKLIRQGPIEDLLEGEAGTIYKMRTTGDATRAQARLSREPWISGVQIHSQDGTSEWRLVVTDEEAAQSHLLRLVLADEAINVLDFGRERPELEEIFVQLVGGE
jgi:ABC-2 type transport system ATP-binding protein